MKEKALFLYLVITLSILALCFVVGVLYEDIFIIVVSGFGIITIQNFAVGKMVINEVRK